MSTTKIDQTYSAAVTVLFVKGAKQQSFILFATTHPGAKMFVLAFVVCAASSWSEL